MTVSCVDDVKSASPILRLMILFESWIESSPQIKDCNEFDREVQVSILLKLYNEITSHRSTFHWCSFDTLLYSQCALAYMFVSIGVLIVMPTVRSRITL